MARLFIAIHLPEAIKAGLTQKYANIPTARWVDMPQLHLTLRFLGDVQSAHISKLDEALTTVQCTPFDMKLQGMGCFPDNPNKPTRVLWTGISAPASLYDLQKSIERAVIGAGFGAEDKPFRPHITLARLKTEKPLPQVQGFLGQHKNYHSLSFHITSFALVESQLSPQGAKYRDMKVYPLQA